MTLPHLDHASRPSATTLAPGDVLGGKYRIDGELGSGGMGVVLSATHLELDAPVAIKVLRHELVQNEEIVGRMLFEARAVARLTSSHVVRVLDVARLASGAPYIVMERLEGRDLAALLSERGPLPVEETVDYVLQACQCLVEAHALGLVHRDLKPENLFLAGTREGAVLKVLDFGISKDTGVSSGPSPRLTPRSVLTSAGYVIGTPFYMSPEQMRGGDVDARADIWSLGAIVYELLSGRCPFEGESFPVVCALVLDENEAPPLAELAPRVPGGLAAVVARCLQKAREARFASVGELVLALAPFGSAEAQRAFERRQRGARIGAPAARLTATPAPVAASVLPTRPASPARRSGLWPVTAAIGALLVGALSWGALRERTDAPSGAAARAVAPAPLVTAAPSAPALPAAVGSAPPLAAPPVTTAPAAAGRESAARSSKPPSARPAALRSGVSPPAPAASATPPRATAPSVNPPGDAWDLERLGGRY